MAAYGKILPPWLLGIPKKLSVNVHGSILPKYRGASPIQSALLSGETVTGVTVMAMSEKMDEGDVLAVKSIPIDRFDTADSLFRKVSEVSGKFLAETLFAYDAGKVRRVPQNHDGATYCSKISKDSGRIDWSSDAEKVFLAWRGYSSWPGIFAFLDGKRVVVEKCDVLDEDECPPGTLPGTVFRHGSDFSVRCGEGALILRRLKIE